MYSSFQSENELRDFANRLGLISMNNLDPNFYEMVALCGSGVAAAFYKFITLNHKIWFGSHALINAYKKEHKPLWDNSVNDTLWLRCMYLENAILSYSSAVDYIYAVLYFNFDLYQSLGKKNIEKQEDVLRISKSIKGTTLSKIDEWLRKQVSTQGFSTDFDVYKNSTTNLREMANDVKHRGCKAVEGTDWPRITWGTAKVNINEINIRNIIAPVTFNIDDEIANLVKVHEQTLDIQNKLYYLCDFQGQFKAFLKNVLRK